tara:strand:+ start:727 stop:1281 length:555 start_codon:yes stop_codon:yes gene_type:complete
MEINLFKIPIEGYQLKQNLSFLKQKSIEIENQSTTVSKSNLGGFNSGNIDPTIFAELTKDILHYGNIFFKKFNFKKELLLDNIWININRYKDSNLSHTHPFSKISGVFYIHAPKNSGDLIFKNPYTISNYLLNNEIHSHNEYNSQEWNIPPKENVLLLFPSWIEHRVGINLSNEERISISFNLN